MSCDVCTAGERRPNSIRYSLSMADRLILSTTYRLKSATGAGRGDLSPDVVERLQQPVWQREHSARFVETPVYESHRPRPVRKEQPGVPWLPVWTRTLRP